MTAASVARILRFRPCLAAFVALTASVAVAASPAMAQADVSGPELVRATHVRGLNPKVSGLLEQGLRRSATLRRLARCLEHTDVIVLITTTGAVSFVGRIAFVSASSTARFLLITLRVPELDDRLLPCLAHELQHALEIASAPSVTSNARFVAYYREFGQGVAPGQWCTREAQRVAAVVDAEIAASPAR